MADEDYLVAIPEPVHPDLAWGRPDCRLLKRVTRALNCHLVFAATEFKNEAFTNHVGMLRGIGVGKIPSALVGKLSRFANFADFCREGLIPIQFNKRCRLNHWAYHLWMGYCSQIVERTCPNAT